VYEFFIAPFAEFGFMRRALVACLALALAGAPLGLMLVWRRMSLMGDAMAHALLPGAAIGFALAGFSLPAMGAGALAAALAVAVLAGWVAQVTTQREDASFAAFYLIALAAGVLILSSHGSPVDLMHVLFGSVLGGRRPVAGADRGRRDRHRAGARPAGAAAGDPDRRPGLPALGGRAGEGRCTWLSWPWSCSTWWPASRPWAP
jgi:hypothetical protein